MCQESLEDFPCINLILTTILWEKYYNSPQFSDEETSGPAQLFHT